MSDSPAVSILIPIHNEQDNLNDLFNDLLPVLAQQSWRAEIVCINDNSRDDSPRLIDEWAQRDARIMPIHRGAGQNGMGYALMEGFTHSRGEFVIWMMGDRSDDPRTLAPMVEKMRAGFDLVFGARYIPGGSVGDQSPLKAFLSRSYSVMANLVFGIPAHDITNAFRGFTRALWHMTNPTRGNFTISPEMAIKAHLLGFRLGEVPTVYHNRTAGVSKFNIPRAVSEYFKLMLYYRFRWSKAQARVSALPSKDL